MQYLYSKVRYDIGNNGVVVTVLAFTVNVAPYGPEGIGTEYMVNPVMETVTVVCESGAVARAGKTVIHEVVEFVVCVGKRTVIEISDY